MSFASCAQYEHGYFTAYARLAQDHPDLVLHLGGYLYEYKKDSYVIGGGNPRDHEGPETTSLAGYRQRHAQYKADADLQAAHAVAPWLVVWDDHAVDNNRAEDIPENTDAGQLNDTTAHFRQRGAAAFQGHYENMPLRASYVPQHPGAEHIHVRLGKRKTSFNAARTIAVDDCINDVVPDSAGGTRTARDLGV